jgi:type IV secretion system protein TrbL
VRLLAPSCVGVCPTTMPFRLSCHHARARTWQAAMACILVLIALTVLASPSHAQTTVLDNTQDAYRTTTRTWLGPLSTIARRLFVSLALIEVSLSAALWTLRRDALDEMAGRFLLKFILLSFVLMLITSAGYWMPVIVNSFSRAGQVAGIAPVPAGPSEIVDIGTTIAFFNIDTRGLGISPADFLTAAFALVSRLVVIGSFLFVAAQVVLAWVESYVALAGGVLFLGFGAFRGTAQYAENYLNYLVFLGVRLFLLYLLLGIGISILQNSLAALPPAMLPKQMAEIMAMSVIFAVLVLRIPNSAANRIAGGANLGIVHALRSL